MTELIHSDLTYLLRGTGFKVHATLKGGHKEHVYEEAFCQVLQKDGVYFRRQPRYNICYKGKQIGEYYPDLDLAAGKVIVDFKATPRIEQLHKMQVLSYVGATGAELGLIINFGGRSLEVKRLPNFLKDRPAMAWTRQFPPNVLYPDLTNQVLETLYEVHHQLGPGFLHQIYRRASRIELSLRHINFDYLTELRVQFDGQLVSTVPTRLFLIDNRLLLATAALTDVTAPHTEKLRWAMKQTNCQLGLLANFYQTKLDVRFLSTG